MNQQLKDAITDPMMLGIVALIGLIIGALCLVYAVLTKKSRKPYWDTRANNIIRAQSSRIAGLEMAYNDPSGAKSPITNLTISKALIWNGGRETIRYQDFAKNDPLRFAVNGQCIILNVALLEENKPELSAFKPPLISPDRKSALLEFDFLDRGNAAVFEVVHTGISADDISMHGYVQQAGRFRRVRLPVRTDRKKQTPQQDNAASFFQLLLIALAVGIELVIVSALTNFLPTIFYLVICSSDIDRRTGLPVKPWRILEGPACVSPLWETAGDGSMVIQPPAKERVLRDRERNDLIAQLQSLQHELTQIRQYGSDMAPELARQRAISNQWAEAAQQQWKRYIDTTTISDGDPVPPAPDPLRPPYNPGLQFALEMGFEASRQQREVEGKISTIKRRLGWS